MGLLFHALNPIKCPFLLLEGVMQNTGTRTLGRLRLAGLVGLTLVTALITGLLYFNIPRNAAGMAAKAVCSATFVAGRYSPTLLAEEVTPASPVLRLIRVETDLGEHSATAHFAGLFARRAVLLPHRGCVLDLDPSVVAPAAPSAMKTTELPWPRGNTPLALDQWERGTDAGALNRWLDAAFEGAGDPLAANARAVALIHRGQLLALRHAPGFAHDTPLHGWSMAKTVTAMLLHKLAADTGLPSDTLVVNAFKVGREPVWLTAWRTDGRSNIKVSDLLYMRDGLASTESYDPWGAVPQMLWGSANVAAFAAAPLLQADPGTRWRYLSATANLLAGVARGRFSSDSDYWAYPAKALFDPIGATSATMETDTDGNWVGSSYVWASAADWGRLGLLMLNDGRWDSQQVLPPGFLKAASTPSTPQGEGLGYGAQTWRLGQPLAGACKQAGLPEDTLAMTGHWGQLVAVVPSREAVIVRLGWTYQRDQFDRCAFIAAALKALPT
jgi:CubicO group peptidase (beta-lactamase class C family)